MLLFEQKMKKNFLNVGEGAVSWSLDIDYLKNILSLFIAFPEQNYRNLWTETFPKAFCSAYIFPLVHAQQYFLAQ